ISIRIFVRMGSQAALVFENDMGRICYMLDTNPRPLVRLIMSGGAPPEGYSYIIRAVSKTGLHGEYKIKVLCDYRLYDTKITMKVGE
ncbi:MAG: hypothetical protein LUD53_05310, partial [Clostridiales bacterium]|nr:hypothetical protein [Clostridiales bacterium]